MRDFLLSPAKARKGKKDIEISVDITFPVKSFTESKINCNIYVAKLSKNVNDLRRFNAQKSEWTPNFFAAVAVAIKPACYLTVSAIAHAKGASEKTFHLILTEELGLVKKSARGWWLLLLLE